MALDRAPRGLTRRCRRRFHFFVAPRSALGAFVFSAHGAPACSLLSERILSEMKQQQQQQQQQQAREALQDLHNKHAREEERHPPLQKALLHIQKFQLQQQQVEQLGIAKPAAAPPVRAMQVQVQQQQQQQSPQTAQKVWKRAYSTESGACGELFLSQRAERARDRSKSSSAAKRRLAFSAWKMG